MLARPLVVVLRHRPISDLQTFVIPDNPGIRLVAMESLLARRIYWHGQEPWEGPELRLWRHCCAQAKSIAELGGNIGVFTVEGALAAPGIPYVVVEPHPMSVSVLGKNLELNGVSGVRVVQAAAIGGEETNGSVTLCLPDAEQYDAPAGAFVQGAEGIARPSTFTVNVPAIPARSVLAGADLWKLDIEGYEAEVLMAVEDVVLTEAPTIFLEVLPDSRELKMLVGRWMGSGYCAFEFVDRIPVELSRDQLLAGSFSGRNIVLVGDRVQGMKLAAALRSQ